LLLPGEDADLCEELRQSVRQNLAPSGPLETFLTDRIFGALWRLRRLEGVENAMLCWRVCKQKIERIECELRSYEHSSMTELDRLLSDEKTVITDEKAHARKSRLLAQLRIDGESDDLLLGRAFDHGLETDAINKLARYETMLERNFYRALHELQRLQAARNGQSVAVPQAVDVNVSLSSEP